MMYKLKAKFYAVNLSSAHQLSPLCRTAAKNLRTSHHLTAGLWTSLSSLHYSTTLCQGLWRKPLNYLSYLRCPKLYCPVKRRGDKKMWEVYRSNCCMAVDTCDWSLVSFKHLTDSSFAVSEYTTKVNWFGNQTSADTDSTEIQFKYSHKKILLPYMDVTPLQNASPQQGHKTRLENRPSVHHVFSTNCKCQNTS